MVVFDATLERLIIQSLKQQFPDLSSKLQAIEDAIVDLAPLFLKHALYLPGMKGRFSLKAILPCINPSMTYDGLIQSGFTL